MQQKNRAVGPVNTFFTPFVFVEINNKNRTLDAKVYLTAKRFDDTTPTDLNRKVVNVPAGREVHVAVLPSETTFGGIIADICGVFPGDVVIKSSRYAGTLGDLTFRGSVPWTAEE